MSKKRKKHTTILVVLSCLIVLITPAVKADACTIFVALQDDGTVLAGNNEDWMYSCPNSIEFSASTEDSFGYIAFYNSTMIQGGMNEYGLFYDGASCPNTTVPHDDEKPDLGYDLGEIILSKCKTVEEVRQLLSNYNMPSSFCDHLLIADSTGASAILEWMNDSQNVIARKSDKNYQIATNYWLTDPSLGGYPCERYENAEKVLKSGSPSLNTCNQILTQSKQDWKDGGTVYSNIYDLSNLTIYVFNRGDMEKACVIDLKKELQTLKTGEDIKYSLQELNYKENWNESKADGMLAAKSISTGCTVFWGLKLAIILALLCISGIVIVIIKRKHKR